MSFWDRWAASRWAAPPVRRFALAALLGVALAAGPPARAASGYDALDGSAQALAAYAASRDTCRYSDKLGAALTAIDAFLARNAGYAWEAAKQAGPDKLIGLRNTGRILGAESDCAIYGTAIGYVVPVYLNAAAFDPEVLAELERLLQGKGRSRSGEAEARAPQPPPPGSAAATMQELYRQNPTMNQSVHTPRASTLQRLPADDGPPPVTRSPPPRQPAVSPAAPTRPRSENEAITPPPSRPPAQTQAPAAAPPTPSPAPTTPQSSPDALIPTSSAAGCRVGGACRLAEPTFACNLTEAQSLAIAGPAQGRQAGLAAVRAGTCEIVAAGRPLLLEATKAPQVVYATENGRHVGYLPVGVFAPAGSGAALACSRPGFCAVRPGPPIWVCPRPQDLDLPTPDAKLAARCAPLAAGQVGQVEAQGTGPIAIRLGGDAPEQQILYAAWADLVGLDAPVTATPVARGWCRPGDWCVTAKTALLCVDRVAYERVMGVPAGEERRKALLASRGCHIVLRSNPMKPASVPAADDPWRLVEVEHPVFKAGWASADVFGLVSFTTPVRYTSRLSDIVVGADRTPSFAAVALRAQGTSEAAGTFRSGARERLAFCRANDGAEGADPLSICLGRPDVTMDAQADCLAKRFTVEGERYRLAERPGDASPDIHGDPQRRWLFQNLASGEWLDGSAQSGELGVRTAFDALCPGANPEASLGLAYRDPRAQYPRELRGRWFDDRRACADPRRDEPDYDTYTYRLITTNTQLGRGSEDRINAVRPVGQSSWAIDEGGTSHEETDTFSTATYTLTREGLRVGVYGRATLWVRCP